MHIYRVNRVILFTKVIRSLFLLGLLLLILSVLFLLFLNFSPNTIYFTNETRGLIIIISLLPFLISLFIFSLYESVHPEQSFSQGTIFKEFIFLIYLLFPALYILYRFEDFVVYVLNAAGVFAALLFLISPLINTNSINLIDLLKEVFINFGSKKIEPINNSLFEDSKVQEKRNPNYFDKEGLVEFQNSYLTHSNEAIILSEHIKTTHFIKDSKLYKILDIGGHDGRFTADLLRRLNINIESIDVVDPLTNQNDYNQNLSSLCSKDKINIYKEKVESFQLNTVESYDLILASHSLYSYIDKDDLNRKRAINHLLKFLEKEGLFIIILGSNLSSAYKFKNNVLDLIYHDFKEDTTAEDISEVLKDFQDLHSFQLNIDNYLDVEELLKDDESFKKWLSYFVRIPRVKDKFVFEQIKEKLYYYSIMAETFPECSKEDINVTQAELLLHKTSGFLISKSKHNVISVNS